MKDIAEKNELTKDQQLVRLAAAAIFSKPSEATRDDLLKHLIEALKEIRNMGAFRCADAAKVFSGQKEHLTKGDVPLRALIKIVNTAIYNNAEGVVNRPVFRSDLPLHMYPIEDSDISTVSSFRAAIAKYIPDIDARLDAVNAIVDGHKREPVVDGHKEKAPARSGELTLDEVESIIGTQLPPGSPGYNMLMTQLREKLAAKQSRGVGEN